MNDIFTPLILARGSHRAGSGKGCAMNVVSWENGDTIITDYPACSDRMLARIVQWVNDGLAGEDGLLSADDSLIALDLGHATVGTSKHGLSDLDLKRVYVQCAVYAARKVLPLDKSGTALPAIEAAEAWVTAPSDADAAADAADAADAASYAAAAASASDSADAASHATASHAAAAAADDAAYDAYDAAYDAAYAAAAAAYAAADAAYAAAYAADADADAAYAAAADAGRDFRINLAREIIDLFKSLTGTKSPEPDENATREAYQKMLVRSR